MTLTLSISGQSGTKTDAYELTMRSPRRTHPPPHEPTPRIVPPIEHTLTAAHTQHMTTDAQPIPTDLTAARGYNGAV